MYDLKSLAPNDAGEELKLLHPTTGEPLVDEDGKPALILLVGMDSQQWRDEQRKQSIKRIKRTVGDVDEAAELEQVGQNAIDLLVACTLDWSGIAWEGKDLEFSADNARMLYTELAWLRDQVDRFIGQRANFISAS